MDGHSIASELNELASSGAWNCAHCWMCIEVCPQGVDIFGFMMKRRKVEEIPELIRKGIDGIFRKGFWFGDSASSMKFVNYLGCRLSGFWAGRRLGS
jgi:Fe-S oxidoreductase